MGVCKLKLDLDTNTVCEPVGIITLEAFNKYILSFIMKLKQTVIEKFV